MGVAVAKKREKTEQGKIEVRAEQSWIDRVEQEARRLGMNRSVYIRLAVIEKMDRAEAEREQRRKTEGSK